MPRPTDEQITAYFDQVSALIRDHGWMIQGVFAAAEGDDVEEFAPFCYTIGLAAKGHPELLVVGFPYDFAGRVLNRLAAIATNGQHTFAHGETLHDDMWRGALRVRGPVDDVAGDCPVHMARNYYAWAGTADPDTLQVLQVDWPDPEGRYADEGGEDGACSPQLPLVEVDAG